MFGLRLPLRRCAPSHTQAARRLCQPLIEELETRLVMTAGMNLARAILPDTDSMTAKVSLANGVLRAVADNEPTTFVLRQVGGSTILNGFKAATRSIKRIEIIGGDKADAVFIRDTPAGKPVVVKTRGGHDTIHVGYKPNLLSSIKGDLTVDAGKGIDALFLHDEADTIGQFYTITANSVTRVGAAPIVFTSALESLTLEAGTGDNQVQQLSTPEATQLVLNLDAGKPGMAQLR